MSVDGNAAVINLRERNVGTWWLRYLTSSQRTHLPTNNHNLMASNLKHHLFNLNALWIRRAVLGLELRSVSFDELAQFVRMR
jgi:hypothetical protein